jgi:endonuclease-3 related protein
MPQSRPKPPIREFFEELLSTWGPQDWWPAYTRLEVIVGAFLTQNTAWINVERALRNLRRAGALNLGGIRNLPLQELKRLVRPAGCFRQKAQRLKNFVRYLDERYEGSLERMFARPRAELREELLAMNGVGPETADSILLYAGGHPVFVVDAYTRRIFERHNVLPAKAGYDEVRALVEAALQDAEVTTDPDKAAPPRAQLPGRRRHKYKVARSAAAARLFDEFHALLVQTAKHHCFKAEAHCNGCPLQRFLSQRTGIDKRKRPV